MALTEASKFFGAAIVPFVFGVRFEEIMIFKKFSCGGVKNSSIEFVGGCIREIIGAE